MVRIFSYYASPVQGEVASKAKPRMTEGLCSQSEPVGAIINRPRIYAVDFKEANNPSVIFYSAKNDSGFAPFAAPESRRG